jgi:cyclic pyranopterin phosphate synthase
MVYFEMEANLQSLTADNIKRGLRLVRMLDFDATSSIGPLRVDIALTSACNYRCVFCGTHSFLRTQAYKPTTLDRITLNQLLLDIQDLGTSEILFAGNGEPFLYDGLPELIKRNEYHKIEVMTNGSLLHLVDREVFAGLSKLTVSLNSGTGATHQRTHGYKGPNEFLGIEDNINRLLNYESGFKKIEPKLRLQSFGPWLKRGELITTSGR